MRIAELSIARAELQQLQRVRAALSETLASHAAQLKSVGALPPEELVDQLLDYRTRLVKLSAEMATVPAGSSPDTHPELTLDAVQSAIDYREVIGGLDETLRQVLRLVHADDPAFAPLADCQADAAFILQSAKPSSDVTLDMSELQATMRTFEALLSLVRLGNELNDDDWTLYQELISARWGRILSTAVARGKIRLTPELEPQTVAPQPVADVECHAVPDTSVRAETLEESIADSTGIELDDTSDIVLASEFEDHATQEAPADDIETVFDTQHDMIFDAVGKPGAERSPSRSYRSNELKLLAAESYQWLQPQPTPRTVFKPVVATNDEVTSLARRALEADPANRGPHLSQLILELLRNDRCGQAYHLARSVEGQMPDRSFVPPAALLHAVTLCRHVCYANGEMGRIIERDLEQFQPDLLTSSDPDANSANGFLARAAALLPALLTTSPAAGQIITSFRISPGLSHLYNYCGRIWTYGQQLQGQAADLFTPDCDSTRWNAEVATLHQEIEQWLPESVKKHCASTKSAQFFLQPHWTLIASTSVRHELATRLWSKWQEVFRIVQRLLKPVRSGEPTERNWIKAEVDRLTHAVQLDSAVNLAVDRGPVEVLPFPDEAMVNVIREAMDFANRWLRLCAAKPGQGRTLMSRDAGILRDEILERTDGVVAELATYSQSHNVPCITASIACLCRTIEHLRMIFSPHSTLPLREAAASQVVSAELLDIPHLEFDGDGLPTLNPNDLEAVLLTHLSGASAEQFENLEYRVTARILESNLRQRERKQEALKPCRTEEVSESCWD